MSSFSEQRQAIRKALVAAGFPADAAARIANILGNSAQEMRHSGAITYDTTSEDLRYVDADARKHRFTNLDPREGDPDHRKPRTQSSEDRRDGEKQPNVIVPIIPQEDDAQFRIAGGKLTDVVGQGQTASINVRNTVAARPVVGLPLTLLDQQANALVGKAPRAQVGQNDGSARLDIQENNQEVLWNLQMLNRSEYDVVTNVEFVEGKGLEVTYERIKAWDKQKKRTDIIPTIEQDIVTEVVEDKRGLRGRRRTIPVFSSSGQANTFFNTFRIGKFTGGWSIGATKSVTQVWPNSEEAVSVINLTQPVPNTPEEKWVLFAIRHKDEVTPAPAPPADPADDTIRDDPHPIMGRAKFNVNHELVEEDGVPEVEYYAVDVQGASSSNEGLVTVLTGVSYTPSGLEFTRKLVYAWGQEIAPVVIALNSCCGCCCVDYAPDPAILTQAECALAGGIWYPGAPCDPSPCCCCSAITLNDLLYGDAEYSWPTLKPFASSTPAFGTVGDPPECPAAPPGEGWVQVGHHWERDTDAGLEKWACSWHLVPACLRWVCRCYDAEGNIVCETTHGGATINSTNLSAIVDSEYPTESAGCYVYTFEFFGWRERNGTAAQMWVGRDDVYSLYRTPVASCP